MIPQQLSSKDDPQVQDDRTKTSISDNNQLNEFTWTLTFSNVVCITVPAMKYKKMPPLSTDAWREHRTACNKVSKKCKDSKLKSMT